MSRRLTITYGDLTLYDGEPAEFSWQESSGGIAVKAGQKRPGLFDSLGMTAVDASRRQTAQKHAALAAAAEEESTNNERDAQ